MICKLVTTRQACGSSKRTLSDGGRTRDYMEEERAQPEMIASNLLSAVFDPRTYADHPVVAHHVRAKRMRDGMAVVDRDRAEGFTPGSHAAEALHYITSKGGERIFSCGGSLEKEFLDRCAMRPDVPDAFMHMIVSIDPDEELTNAQWRVVVREQIRAAVMGAYADDCRYAKANGYRLPPKPDPDSLLHIAEKHNDRDHQHVHILLCRIDGNGHLYRGNNFLPHAMACSRRLEKQYGLRELRSFDKVMSDREDRLKRGYVVGARREDPADRQGHLPSYGERALLAQGAFFQAASWEDLQVRWKDLGLDLGKDDRGRYRFAGRSGGHVKPVELGLIRDMSVSRMRLRLLEEERSGDPLLKAKRLADGALHSREIEHLKEYHRLKGDTSNTAVTKAMDGDGAWRHRPKNPDRTPSQRRTTEGLKRMTASRAEKSDPHRRQVLLDRARQAIRQKVDAARVPTRRYITDQLSREDMTLFQFKGRDYVQVEGLRFGGDELFPDGWLTTTLCAADRAESRDRVVALLADEIEKVTSQKGGSVTMQDIQVQVTNTSKARKLDIVWSEEGWMVTHVHRKQTMPLSELGVVFEGVDPQSPAARFGHFHPDVISPPASHGSQFGVDWQRVRDGQRPKPWLRLVAQRSAPRPASLPSLDRNRDQARER